MASIEQTTPVRRRQAVSTRETAPNGETERTLSTEIRHPAVILIGDTGVGKSTLGNYLLGHLEGGPFGTGDTQESVTTGRQVELLKINDNKYSLIDTPGLFEIYGHTKKKDAWKILKETINDCTYGIQAIIFVIRKQSGKKNWQHIQGTIDMLGNKALGNAMVAFTHTTKDNAVDRNLQQYFNNDITIRTFINKVEDRWFVSVNPDYVQLEKSIHESNIKKAKELIESFTKAFTSRDFNMLGLKDWLNVIAVVILLCLCSFIFGVNIHLKR